MSDRCPTCGQAVKVFTGSEGTSSYDKLAERQLEEVGRLLDLSDAWTLEQAVPGEMVSCTRSKEVWLEVLARLSPGEGL